MFNKYIEHYHEIKRDFISLVFLNKNTCVSARTAFNHMTGNSNSRDVAAACIAEFIDRVGALRAIIRLS